MVSRLSQEDFRRCQAFQEKFKELAWMRWPRITQTIIGHETGLHHTTISKMLHCKDEQELFQPAGRDNLVKILKVFVTYERISSPDEANEFLQFVFPKEHLRKENPLDYEVIALLEQQAQKRNHEDDLAKQNSMNPPFISSSEQAQLIDLYLKHVITDTKPLPWGYLPGDFTSELEIDDVYVPPRLSSKEQWRVSADDERLERELIRQSTQDQETEKKRRPSGFKAEKPSHWSLYEILQSGANTTLLGYMGTGKSMAASYIALRLAKGEGESILGLSKSKIPILLRLGRIRETPASDLITGAIENAVTTLDHAHALKDILRQEWKQGNILFILDALDEFGGDLEWLSHQIVQLGDRNLNKSSILLTSRPHAYRSVRTIGLKVFTLEELQREEMSDFVKKWTEAFRKITGRTDINAQNHARLLTNDIGKQFLVQEITSNQLLLTILTILSLRPGGIRLERVKTEAQLLNAYVTDLIDRERGKGVEAPVRYGTDLLRIVFSYVGFEVQRSQSGLQGDICTYDSLVRMLSQSKYLRSLSNPTVHAEAVLRFWLDTALIHQTDNEARSIQVRHQAFQYLGAALALTYQSEERAAQILADVDTGWPDVRRLYISLKAHSQSILE